MMAQPVTIEFVDEYDELFADPETATAPEDEAFDYREEDPNILAALLRHPRGPDEVKKIAAKVKLDFDNAWDSSSEYRENQARDWRMYVGELPPKDFPFEGAANAHIPMTLENLSRLHLRVMGELFGDWTNVFAVAAVGPDDRDQTELMSIHGNWQIQEQIDDFPREQFRGLLMFLGPGDVTCHSYFDRQKGTNRHEMLTCDEFVVPYTMTSTAPDWSDVPYTVKILHMYRNQIEAMSEHWHEVERLFKNPADWSHEPDAPLTRAANEIMGLMAPSQDEHAPYKLLQYEGWMLLPGQTRQRYVQVIQEYNHSLILSLRIHEAPDWRERAKHQQRLDELRLWEDQMQAYDEQQATAGENRDELQARLAAGESMNMMDAALIDEPSAEPPPPPSWFDREGGLPPVKKSPIFMYSHAVCIEPLAGNLGLGYTRVLAELNRGADTLLSQYIDAGTLANGQSILHTANVQFPADWKVRPGSTTVVKGVSGREFKDGVMPLQWAGANPQLKEIAQLLISFGQGAVQAPDVLSGSPGKSGEAYRGLAARIEQASKQISVVSRKYAKPFLTNILRNNARLNSFHMDEEEFFSVVNHKLQTTKSHKIGRAMYERDYNVIIQADLRFTTQAQRIAEADELLSMWAANPVLIQNLAFLWEAVKKALTARGLDDMVPLLGPRPEPPPQMVAPPQPPPQQ